VSVIVIVRFPVSDVAKAVDGLRAQATLLEEMTKANKKGGNLGHRVGAGDGELVIVDEWETVEQFQGFYADNANVEHISAELGVIGSPAILVLASVDAPGTF
jgi:hypothetical protein